MAQSTQDTAAFAITQKERGSTNLAAAQQLLTDLNLDDEIEPYQIVVQVRLGFRQPAGASLDGEEFIAKLQELKLIP